MKRNVVHGVGFAAGLFCFVVSGLAAAGPAGTIHGYVKWVGPVPAPSVVQVTKDHHVCGHTQTDARVVVGEGGGLANAVVEVLEVKAPSKPPAPLPEVIVDQVACRYEPRVTAFVKGTTVVIKNSDATLHNTHTYLEQNGSTLFNLALPAAGMSVKKKINSPGLIRYTCDAGHPWMQAWSYVTDHAYVAVTDARGRFVIDGLPLGKHRLRAWHEVGGYQEATVEISEGGAGEVTLSFSPRP